MVKNIKNDLVEFEYDGGTLVRFFKRYRYISSENVDLLCCGESGQSVGGFVSVLDRPVRFKSRDLERFMV